MHCSTTSPKFLPVSLYDPPFSRYSTFYVFPLTHMLKFQSATIFLKLGRLPRKVIFHHGSQCPQKVWLTSDESCRISLLKFPATYGPVLTEISKCHKIFKTWPIATKSNSLYFTMVANVLIKFGWHRMKTVGGTDHRTTTYSSTTVRGRRSSVLKFPAHMVLC